VYSGYGPGVDSLFYQSNLGMICPALNQSDEC
jgi:hypothetical protein